MGVSVKNLWSPLCLDALNTYFHRPEIPVGVLKAAGVDGTSKYAQEIAREFPHVLKSTADAPNATLLYRQVLAKQPDGSVVMVSVGPLTNFRNLLKSGADEVSRLGGLELVKQKVRIWVCMGGIAPAGREYNLISDGPAAAYAIRNWPTPVIFSGFEIGDDIMTGSGLRNAPSRSPVRRAFELFNGLTNRQSWDETAVLYAVRGLNGGLRDFWDVDSKKCLTVNEDGSDAWRTCAESRRSYLVKKAPPAEIARTIEALMLAKNGQLAPLPVGK